jgi:hypothetical protein
VVTLFALATLRLARHPLLPLIPEVRPQEGKYGVKAWVKLLITIVNGQFNHFGSLVVTSLVKMRLLD